MTGAPPLLNAIGAAIKHLGTRQRIIAQNVANADTPGFKARDAAPPDFAGMLDIRESGAVHVARPMVQISDSMRALGAGSLHIESIADADIVETKPDGNNVTLEDQLLKMGQIQSDFATLTSLYRKQMGLMRSALGKGGTS